MKTIQMTLDEDLVRDVDRAARKLKLSRSAFTRHALRESLARYTVAEQEKKHREGYLKKPAGKSEFSGWEDEQAWGEP